jgi:hypothetical protein
MTERSNGAGKGANNICKATGFGKGNALRCHKRNAHSEGPPRQKWPDWVTVKR